MPLYDITSPKTGQTYRANFDREPEDADIEEAVAAFDADEFAARGGEGDPALMNQGVAGTALATVPQTFAKFGTSMVGGASKLLDKATDIVANVTGLKKGGMFGDIADSTDALQQQAARTYPTNPFNAKTQTIVGGAAQGATLLAGGIAGKALGMGNTALATVPLAAGGLAGAGEGIDKAEEIGVESPQGQLAMGLLFGGVEIATEKLGGIGNKAATQALMDQFRKPAGEMLQQAAKTIGGEAGEEALAGGAQDLLIRAFANEDPERPGFTKTGVELPQLDRKMLERRAMEALGGAAGGTVFAGVQSLDNLAAPEQQPVAEDVSAPPDGVLMPAATRQPLLMRPGGTGVLSADQTRGAAYNGPSAEEQAQIEAMPGYWDRAQAQIEQQVGQQVPAASVSPSPSLPVSESSAPIPTMQELAMNAGRDDSTTAPPNEAAEMTLDEAAALPDAPASTRLQFSKNKPLRNNFNEVRAGDPVAAVKKHMPVAADAMPRLSNEQTTDETTAVAVIEQMLVANPVITDAQGKRVLLANQERGSLTTRARHLAASHAVEDRFKKGPRIYKAGKAASAAAVPQTVQDYHLKSEDKTTGTILYLRRYKDGVHAVITDNQGAVSDFGEVDASLLTQRRPDGKDAFRRFVVVDKRTPGMAPSLDRARVSQTQEPAQQQLPRTQLSAAPAKVKTATRKAVTDALKILADRLPGLQHGRVLAFANADEFLSAGYAGAQSFTAEEIASMADAEAFFDQLTGHTIVFTDQISIREGETPMRAVARVLLHERVGHEGVNTLIAQDASARDRWNKIASLIPAAELDGIAAEAGYTHLAGDRAQLALEWLARQVESVEGARSAIDIERSLAGTARQLWQALKEMLARAFAGFSRSAAFAHEVHEIINLARDAAMKGSAVPTSAEALAQRVQFSMVSHTPGTPFEVRNLMVRSLLTNSPLPTSMRDTLAETKNEKDALDHAAARIGTMIELGVAAVVKRTGAPVADVYQLVNDVFDGKPQAHAVLQTVDDTLAEAARKGRALLDQMSETIGLYLPAGTMRTTIMQNLGGWMRRGYAVFDAGANWNYKTLRAAADKDVLHNGQDARKLMQNAVKHIVSQNSKLAGQVGLHGLPRADTELSGILIDLLDRDTTMNALIPGRGNTVRKDVSSLIRRKEIAPAIRALMGEHTSPLKRYAASASFQTQFIAKYQAQARMRQMGLATGLFSTTQTDTYHDAIPEADSWGPLAGLYTTRELLTAMEQASMLNVAGSDMPSLIGKAYKAILANAKMNMVALNPKSTAVNLIGGGVSSVASGDLLAPGIVERFRKAITLAWRDGTPTKADMVNAHTLALRDVEAEERAFLIGSGLLNNNVTLAEIEANTPEALQSLLGDANAKLANAAVGAAHGMAAGNALGRVAGPAGQAVGIALGGATGAVVGGKNVQAAYKWLAEVMASKPDAMWKVAAFYSQRRTALLAGMPPADAAKRAVERVRNTYPDYSKIHPIIRHLSLLPVLGNFVSFSHELVRNLVWNIRYAKQDLASGNTALRADAMRRIAGSSAAYLLSTPLLNAAGTLLFGWMDDDDEREDIFREWLAADYEKDAALTFKSANVEGVTYFKQSYLIPQGIFGDMLTTAASHASEGEIGDAILRPTAMLLSQFGIGQNIFNTLVEAASGEDKYKRRIYSDHDNAAVKLLKGGDHVAKTFADPGYAKIIEQMVRHAQSGNTEELGRLGNGLMGVRDRRVTWDKAVTSAYYKFRSQIQAVKDDAKQKLDPRNQHLLTQSTQIVDGANAALTEIEGEIARFESDMGRLPIPAGVVSKARREVLPRKISRVEFKP